ncbi:MAG: ATP-binding cassette domain-containing protein [Candidatus Peribacteria bacterium]|nr:MAG: ATP-binding cassette domain-containing protein [Candidatus Peribacteria bacterium]
MSWGYTPERSLFQGFDLSIREGDFMILQGRSGTGKSTLVNMLTGYLSAPAKSIYYRYEDVAKMSAHELQEYRRQIGIVFQDTKLISNLSVRDNIMYPLKVYGHDDEDVERRYKHFIRLIELEERADALVQELS